ncbi:MAG: hypothetical protein ACK4TA_14175 [Saprospiraceae bacterium]
MEVPLQVYEPTNQSFTLIWVALALFVVSAVGAFWLFRQDTAHRGSQYTGLLGMLVGFIALISLGTGIFGWLATAKTGTVKIYADRIELGNHPITFRNIDNAKVEESRETSWVNPNITKRSVQLLFIADRAGNTYVLSEENYPIKEIINKLRKAIADWEATSFNDSK